MAESQDQGSTHGKVGLLNLVIGQMTKCMVKVLTFMPSQNQDYNWLGHLKVERHQENVSIMCLHQSTTRQTG